MPSQFPKPRTTARRLAWMAGCTALVVLAAGMEVARAEPAAPKRVASLLSLNQPLPGRPGLLLEESTGGGGGTLPEPRSGAALFEPPPLDDGSTWSSETSASSCQVCRQRRCGCGRDPAPNWIENFSIAQNIEGFKGPLDLNGANGNFGTRTTLNGAWPLLSRLGLGAQLGTAVGWYDFKGTQFTGPASRFQSYTTAGVFQQALEGDLQWGVAYDFLYDAYYKKFNFGQWRVKAGYQLHPRHEVGAWATLAGYGDVAVIDAAGTINRFRPITQGCVYWQHAWQTGILTEARFGVSEKPGQFVYGGEALAPLSDSLALVGNFHFITAAGGPRNATSRAEELWNVSLGLAWHPGSRARTAGGHRFRPLLGVADNGSFAVTRDR